MFGDPIKPPPETVASEEAYGELIREVRNRVVEMRKMLQHHSR